VRGVACGSANAMTDTPGRVEYGTVQALVNGVVVEKIS